MVVDGSRVITRLQAAKQVIAVRVTTVDIFKEHFHLFLW